MLKAHERIAALEFAVVTLSDDIEHARQDLNRMGAQTSGLQQALKALVEQMVAEGRLNELLIHPEMAVRDLATQIASQKWIKHGND